MLLAALMLTFQAFAQSKQDTLAKDNRLIPLPTVSINFGINHMMGDVSLSNVGPSPFTQFGYQLTITQRTFKFLNTSLELFSGTIYGEQMVNQTNLNFRTSLFSQRLSFEYNFYPLLKPDAQGRQLIRPYVGVGFGALLFRSKGDLKDEHGTAYQFWSDGSINAEAEGTVDATEATPLTRDFVYETDLRDANLDGLRKYPQLAFTMPINAGIRFQVSKNVGLNASFAYCMNFTDMLDNVSTSGTGERQGKAGNDNHLFGSIGLTVFLGNTRPSAKPAKPSKEELAAAKAEEKRIKQEQKEQEKKAAAETAPTPTQETTESSEQADTESVDEPSESVTKTEEARPTDNTQVTERVEQPSSDKKPVDLTAITSINIQDVPPKETATFHWADLDNSGMITPDEVLHFIDQLFEGEGERSVEDIQNLIDYYFDQE